MTTNLIGEGSARRTLFWEEAEGGKAVFRRAMDEATAIAEVVRVALEVCHFDPATGEDRKAGEDGCSRAWHLMPPAGSAARHLHQRTVSHFP